MGAGVWKELNTRMGFSFLAEILCRELTLDHGDFMGGNR